MVHVVVNWDDQSLSIEVRDDGPGFPLLVLEYAGRAPFPVHVGGSGIGLFLAQAATTRPVSYTHLDVYKRQHKAADFM